MTSKFTELAVECADPVCLARFCCAVLDYEVHREGDGAVTFGSPSSSRVRSANHGAFMVRPVRRHVRVRCDRAAGPGDHGQVLMTSK